MVRPEYVPKILSSSVQKDAYDVHRLRSPARSLPRRFTSDNTDATRVESIQLRLRRVVELPRFVAPSDNRGDQPHVVRKLQLFLQAFVFPQLHQLAEPLPCYLAAGLDVRQRIAVAPDLVPQELCL